MIAWIDGSAGASGDMLLGALVGVGVPLDALTEPIESLGLDLTLDRHDVQRGGLAATKVDVVTRTGEPVGPEHHHRGLGDVLAILHTLDEPLRSTAAAVFDRLARAEAEVHGIDVEEVHFHEVGALDAIADIVGVCAGFLHLCDEDGVNEVVASTLSLGSGQTRGAHGPIPIPAPAVLALLQGVAPAAAGPAPFESTTPTGAALLAELVDRWGPMPEMTLESVGMGAGGRDSDLVVNAVRLVVGDEPSMP